MHHLKVREWPYKYVKREQYPKFVSGMSSYYLQLGARALRPPRIEDFIGSPFPFFFEMDCTDDDDFDVGNIRIYAESKKQSEEYIAFCEDVITYFKMERFTHDQEHIKGGGFSCLSY